MNKYVVGIDPGSNGAIYILKNGKRFFSTTYPKLPSGEFDRVKIFSLFKRIKKLTRKDSVLVVIEKVHAHQMAGGSSNFSFGRAVEMIDCITVLLKLRHVHVTPSVWQKVSWEGVTLVYKPTKKSENKKPRKVVDTKKTSDRASCKLFPEEKYLDNFLTRSTKRHDGLIDASLIAWYGHIKGY